MKKEMQVMLVVLLFAFPSILYAGGQYSIGQDHGGVYMQTDMDGSWYIDSAHVNSFRVGEKGNYSSGVDHFGCYIETGKGRKFYIDKTAQEKLKSELDNSPDRMGQGKQTETKVTIIGNQVLVPVILEYKGKNAEVLLLLDTGASITVLHREVADQLKMKGIQKGRMILAGGEAINADLIKLDSVKAGPISKRNIAAGVIDFKGSTPRHQGLLGMNFLKNVVYRIDAKRQTIKWEN